MKKATFVAAALGLTLACSTCAFAWAAEHRPGPIVQQDSWPQGLADALNSQPRVYGYWCNAQDYFYYSGDTATFNSFIKRLSELERLSLTLVVHAGRGVAAKLGEKDASVDYDWMITPPSAWSSGSLADTPVIEASAQIDLWLCGNIALDNIVVPLSVDVRSGGEIEQFVAKHRAARAEEPPKPTDEPQ